MYMGVRITTHLRKVSTESKQGKQRGKRTQWQGHEGNEIIHVTEDTFKKRLSEIKLVTVKIVTVKNIIH